MPSCPTLPASRQLLDELSLSPEELCTPQRLPSLLDAVRTVPDPRTAHLVTHPWPMLLGLVACALLCGVRSVRGAVRWARGQGAGVLAALEVPDGDASRLPVTTALTRALARLDADALDAAVRTFVQAHAADPLADLAGDPPVLQLAADGKTVRGARDEDGRQLHLLGVYQVDPGVMLAQREMRHKPHETLHFTAALHLIADITGAIVTADASTPSPPTPATCTAAAPTASSPSRRTARPSSPSSTRSTGTRPATRRSPCTAPRRPTQAATRPASSASSRSPPAR
jgi:hypothetical protein